MFYITIIIIRYCLLQFNAALKPLWFLNKEGSIKVNKWPILLTVLHYLMKVSVPLFNNAWLFVVVIHSLLSIPETL